MKIVSELQGELIDDSININANSAIRRSCSLTFVVKNKSYVVGSGSQIWFDKYIKIWFGIFCLRDKSIYYYPMGLYNFENTSYEYSSNSSTLTLSVLDLMSQLNGIRNGHLSALMSKIPADVKIREVIISILTQFGNIKKYYVENLDNVVPYDIEIKSGITIYDMLTTLLDLYPSQEMFFDEDIFICQKIPSCKNDLFFMDENIFNPLVIKEITTNSFSKVKNCTEVWGKSIDSDYYTEQVNIIGNQYVLNINNFLLTDQGDIPSNTSIGFKVNTTNSNNSSIKINSLNSSYPIVDVNNNNISPNKLTAGKSYVVKYSKEKFILLGQYQIHAIVKLYSSMPLSEEILKDRIEENCDNISYVINPDSPYCIDKIGLIRNVLSDSEYSKIYSDDLALERAKYENWKTTRMPDDVTIEIIAIPWLDVNKKIKYTSLLTGETEEYIIKNISGSISKGTMTVNMIKFYPLYPD